MRVATPLLMVPPALQALRYQAVVLVAVLQLPVPLRLQPTAVPARIPRLALQLQQLAQLTLLRFQARTLPSPSTQPLAQL